MKKQSIFLIFLIGLTLLTGPRYLLAVEQGELERQIEQIRREREELLAEQRQLEKELEATSEESRNLGTAVKSLDTTRKKLSKDISITQSRIASADLTIATLEKSANEKERQVLAHRRAAADILASLSDHDSRPLLLGLLASAPISELWRDKNELESLSTKLDEEIDNLRKRRQELNENKNEEIKTKESQLLLKDRLSDQRFAVEENKKAKEELLTITKNKEEEYQRILEENLARQKEFDEDLFRLESELNLIIDPSLIPEARHGLLAWPLESIYVTSPYGPRSTGFHRGVDFRATPGTPIMAIADGVVEGSANSDDQKGCYSFGRWILLKHNNGLSSVYAHLSASFVKVGQAVGRGEVIAYSGGYPGVYGSGNSRGPHLHLGLFSSQGVEVRPFTSERYLTTGAGCHDVLIPVSDIKAYLNPLDYLPTL